MQLQSSGFRALPVELVYEIQLHAISPSLPYISRHFLDIFKGSPISFRVQFLLASCTSTFLLPIHAADFFSRALRYPLCTPPVLDHLHSFIETLSKNGSSWVIPHAPSTHIPPVHKCKLPRRFFRYLTPRENGENWKATDKPLPFLTHILRKGETFPPLDPNHNQGYALTRAVHARNIPLIQFLLDLGASPMLNDSLAVKVAIKQRNLGIVKMLVEREDRDPLFTSYSLPASKETRPKQKGKRRRLEDRVEVDQSMLRLAVKCGARDIIDYLAWEKGVVPDMQTLRSLQS